MRGSLRQTPTDLVINSKALADPGSIPSHLICAALAALLQAVHLTYISTALSNESNSAPASSHPEQRRGCQH